MHQTPKNPLPDVSAADYFGPPKVKIEPLQEIILSFPLLRRLEFYGIKLSSITSATPFSCHGVLAALRAIVFDDCDEPIVSWLNTIRPSLQIT
jgi:hypothetical protein